MDSQNNQPQAPKKRRRKSFGTQAQIGMKKLLGISKEAFLKRYYERRYLLTVPKEIADANPDKYFVYLNMNELEKNGYHHPGGYTLYKVSHDPENMNNEKFNKSLDGYIHRNEMVLAYISQEEHELQVIEEQVAREAVRMEDLIMKSEALRGFAPQATYTREVVHE